MLGGEKKNQNQKTLRNEQEAASDLSPPSSKARWLLIIMYHLTHLGFYFSVYVLGVVYSSDLLGRVLRPCIKPGRALEGPTCWEKPKGAVATEAQKCQEPNCFGLSLCRTKLQRM